LGVGRTGTRRFRDTISLWHVDTFTSIGWTTHTVGGWPYSFGRVEGSAQDGVNNDRHKGIVRGTVRSGTKGTWRITEKEVGVKDECVLTGG